MGRDSSLNVNSSLQVFVFEHLLPADVLGFFFFFFGQLWHLYWLSLAGGNGTLGRADSIAQPHFLTILNFLVKDTVRLTIPLLLPD